MHNPIILHHCWDHTSRSNHKNYSSNTDATAATTCAVLRRRLNWCVFISLTFPHVHQDILATSPSFFLSFSPSRLSFLLSFTSFFLSFPPSFFLSFYLFFSENQGYGLSQHSTGSHPSLSYTPILSYISPQCIPTTQKHTHTHTHTHT